MRSDDLPPGVAETAAVQKLDRDLFERYLRFGRSRYDKPWIDAAMIAYTAVGESELGDEELQLALPWAFHAWPWGPAKECLAEAFRREQGRRLPPDMRAVLDAQLLAWCSFWHVDHVDAGVGLGLRDLLTHEERYVHERLGSATLPPGVVIFGRVVDVGDISFLAGLHPRPLPPLALEPTLREARRHCRVRTRPIPPETLRDPQMQLWLIHEWRGLAAAVNQLPRLSNTDGDAFQLTTDHFEFDPADRRALLESLSRLDGAEEPQAGETPDETETEIVITRARNARDKAMDNTIIGRLLVGDGRLRLETNSARRADHLRRAVEKLAGALVRHRLRSESNTQQMLEAARAAAEREGPLPPRPEPSSDEAAIVREYKERHYAAWVDDKLPALGGLSPRVAARSPGSRAMLESLLRQIEQGEAMLPAAERYDVRILRRVLGM